MIQLALAVFGLASAWMAMVSLSARMQRWAPVVGLCGQPAWAAFALSLDPAIGWPLYLTVPAFTLVYLKGCWVRWTWADVKAELLAEPVKALANSVIKWGFRLIGVKR